MWDKWTATESYFLLKKVYSTDDIKNVPLYQNVSFFILNKTGISFTVCLTSIPYPIFTDYLHSKILQKLDLNNYLFLKSAFAI